MISNAVRVAASRGTSRAITRYGGKRTLSTIVDQLKSKTKVEEDRYIKALETARAELKRERIAAERAVVEANRAEEHYNKVVVPAMEELSTMLENTGDAISPEGLELLARWKQGKSV